MKPKHLTVIMNDHTVDGLAAVGLPDSIELATVRRGASGSMTKFANPKTGMSISISLSTDSPSLSFFLERMKTQIEDGVEVWNGCIKDIRHRCVLTLSNGVMVSGPLGALMDPSLDKDFAFEFENSSYTFA